MTAGTERSGKYTLPIETGWFNGSLKQKDVLCYFGETQDKVHFMFYSHYVMI